MFIVSANYFDRNDKHFPWLIRKEYHDIDGAVPAKTVCGEIVEFKESPKGESGFGCTVVAYCKNATFNDDTPTGVVMQAVDFDGFNIVRRLDKQLIRSCDKLILEQNGDMFVVLN